MTTSPVTVGAPICVALDTANAEQALGLAAVVGPEVGFVKVGLTSFIAAGPPLVRDLVANTNVFLDLKLHDIPAQVAGAVAAISGLGVELTTVHAAGGRTMLQAAAEAATGTKVVAVTVLTSLDDSDLSDIGLSGSSKDAVLRLAELALNAGVDGLVCSPLEVSALRERFGSHADGGPYLVVPGIRPAGSDADDQRRTLTPKEALDAGADLLVIGRPITGAPDPAAAARSIAQSL